MRRQTHWKEILLVKGKNKSGTTLVEMIVTLMLIGIMLSMATASLASASRVFIQVQKTQYAQSILDTVMTELRTKTADAVTYVKIYENGKKIAGNYGKNKGNAIEFMNSDSYIELVTTDAESSEVRIYDSDLKDTGVKETMNSGQLYTRYYTVATNEQDTINYSYKPPATTGNYLVARAITASYGEGFYMNNYVRITYSVPEGTKAGDEISSVNATVALYSDESYSEASKVAEDTEPLYFRNPVKYKTDQTARAIDIKK